jgi:hypothetical protein
MDEGRRSRQGTIGARGWRNSVYDFAKAAEAGSGGWFAAIRDTGPRFSARSVADYESQTRKRGASWRQSRVDNIIHLIAVRLAAGAGGTPTYDRWLLYEAQKRLRELENAIAARKAHAEAAKEP